MKEYNHACKKCDEFMVGYKIKGEWVLFCPNCDKDKLIEIQNRSYQ